MSLLLTLTGMPMLTLFRLLMIEAKSLKLTLVQRVTGMPVSPDIAPTSSGVFLHAQVVPIPRRLQLLFRLMRALCRTEMSASPVVSGLMCVRTTELAWQMLLAEPPLMWLVDPLAFMSSTQNGALGSVGASESCALSETLFLSSMATRMENVRSVISMLTSACPVHPSVWRVLKLRCSRVRLSSRLLHLS